MIKYIQKICLQGELEMIAYVKGKLDTKTNTFVVIDVQGIGYRVFMLKTLWRLNIKKEKG